MALSIEKQNRGLDSSLPQRGVIYDMIYAARCGTDIADRLRAVVALGKSDDPRAVRPLMDLLSDTDPEIRLSATTALGHLKSGRPVDELIGRLKDRSEQTVIREQAAVALSAIRSTGALRGLREFVNDQDEDLTLRSYTKNLLNGAGMW